MSRVILVVLVLLHGIAFAEPSRVVLADPDPELRRAIERALAPWKIEVRVEPAPPADATDARARADASRAQFVVWRTPAGLVVYDRQREVSEQRPAKTGSLDAVTAATVALTVKTLLRLPPLEPAATPITTTTPPAQPGIEFGVEAGGALRIAHGSQTDAGARASLALWIQPVASLGLRLALAGDLGTTTDVSHASFKGTASDWAVFGGAGWTFETGGWELAPELAIGVQRSSLSGTEMMATQRDERATSAVVRGAVAARRRFGRWTAGAALGIETIVGTPTYTRSMGGTIYEVPWFAVVMGLTVGAELSH